MDWIEVTLEVMLDVLEAHTVDSEADPGGSELFDMLVGLTSGEALIIMRGTQEMNGFLAWKGLRERLSPNTPAKALALMMEVMNSEARERSEPDPQAIGVWDLKMQRPPGHDVPPGGEPEGLLGRQGPVEGTCAEPHLFSL